MLGERFVYLRISDICIGPGNMDGERAKNVGRRRNWQSFFPSSSPILRFTPPPLLISWAESWKFRNPASFFLARHRALYFLYIRTTFRSPTFYSSPRGSRLSKYFCNPRKWCIPKGNRFHPWTRPLCTSEPDILVSASPDLSEFLTNRNSSFLLSSTGIVESSSIPILFFLLFFLFVLLYFSFAKIEDLKLV